MLLPKLCKLWRDHCLAISLHGVIAIVILMILFSRKEVWNRQNLRHDRIAPDLFCLILPDDGFGLIFLAVSVIKNDGAILGTDICALAIQGRWIMDRKKNLQKSPDTHDIIVEPQLHNLCVPCGTLPRQTTVR